MVDMDLVIVADDDDPRIRARHEADMQTLRTAVERAAGTPVGNALARRLQELDGTETVRTTGRTAKKAASSRTPRRDGIE